MALERLVKPYYAKHCRHFSLHNDPEGLYIPYVKGAFSTPPPRTLVWVCIHIYTKLYVFVCLFVCRFMYACLYVCMYVCMYVRMYVCMYRYVCLFYVRMYVYVYYTLKNPGSELTISGSILTRNPNPLGPYSFRVSVTRRKVSVTYWPFSGSHLYTVTRKSESLVCTLSGSVWPGIRIRWGRTPSGSAWPGEKCR